MTETPVRLLVVEDNAIVAQDLRQMLMALEYDVVEVVSSGEEAMYCAGMLHPDLVLLDIGLEGAFDGISVAEEIRATLNIPVVFVTAFADAETLQRAKITEPFGYIFKPFQQSELHRTIEMALYKDRSDRMVRDSQERYSLAVRGANDGIWDWNLRTGEIYFSPRWKEIIGYSDADVFTVDIWRSHIHPDDSKRMWEEYNKHLSGELLQFEAEYRMRHKDGTYRWVLGKGVCLRDIKGVPYRIAGSQTDISRRKKEQEDREHLIEELRDALGNIRKLSGLLPICASCKKIRDDEGYWNQVETYLMEHTSVQFTHGICPECSEKLYPR
ncbi:MAG: PAS domain-containing protein [Ignavibacteriales bacterium]|nr:PAS domain-containing protein [Ignavibacteriales bacterium]